MSWFANYRQIRFEKGLLNLYSARLLYDFGINLFDLFLPIFLYQQYGDIWLVIAYIGAGSLGYVITLPWGAKLMGKLGVTTSMMIATGVRALFFISFFFFTYNPLLFSIISALSIIVVRNLFWIPFHTECARLSDKKNRGKQFGLIFSIASLLSIIAPIVAGYILQNWSFAMLSLLALLFSIASVIPLLKVPKFKEDFSWTFGETWKYVIHPFNRRMVTAYMSDGFVTVIGGVFWPLFIFTILDEQYQALGLLTGAIVLAGIVLRLFIGNLLDQWKKTKLVKLGAALNSTAWLVKTVVSSGFSIFLASTYHALALIVLRTSLDTLVYEKAADRGHYVDEYTVIKDMALHSGRVIALLLVGVLLMFLPIQASFILAGIFTLFINLLH